MIKENWDKCTGCGSCLNICPKNAISFVSDEKGFLRPLINQQWCVDCGLCEKTCPVDSDIVKNHVKTTYAAFANDLEILNNTSSGGIFSVISNYFIENGGVVYGAAFSDNWLVKHIRCENKEQIKLLRGSKYTQSDLTEIFYQIKRDLDSRLNVLFSGTPCQCAAVLMYCRTKKVLTDKLYMVEILCEGVNSPFIWRDYFNFIAKGSAVKKVDFRSKINGWKNKTFVIEYDASENKKDFIERYSENYFAQLFSGHYILRPSCNKCYFAEEKRVSDLTLGDFWAYEKLPNSFCNEQGISIVLVNSSKGIELFNKISSQITILETDLQIAKQRQSSLIHPTKKNSDSEKLWKEYRNRGFQYILKKYTTYGVVVRLKREVRKILHR